MPAMDEPDDTLASPPAWTPEHHARYSATMDRKRVDLIARKQKEIANLLALATQPARFIKPSAHEGPVCMRGHSLAPPNGVPKYGKDGVLIQTVCKACNALRARLRMHGLTLPRPEKAICKYGHALTPTNLLILAPTASHPKQRRMCKLCYSRRNRENGRKAYVPRPRKPPTLLERLEKFTRKTPGHWYWTASNDALTFEGMRHTMRRWWLQAVGGTKLKGRSQMILMDCGDANCVNPAHYRIVFTREEMKGRSHLMHEAVMAMSPEERKQFNLRRGQTLRKTHAEMRRKQLKRADNVILVAQESAKLKRLLARKVKNPADIDDLLQESYLQMLKARTVDYRSPTAMGITIARHLAWHEWKKTNSRPRHEPLEQTDSDGEIRVVQVSDGESVLDRLEREEITVVLRRAMAALTPVQVQVFELFQEGFSYKEIASQLGMALNAVHNHLQCGRDLLRQRMKKLGVTPPK